MQRPAVPNLHAGGPENRPDPLTWAALLGRWTDFARASAALPTSGTGGRWRESVAPIVTLQAVCHALSEASLLPPAERALGLDRAEVLIRESSSRLRSIWTDDMPGGAIDLIVDAEAALAAARSL